MSERLTDLERVIIIGLEGAPEDIAALREATDRDVIAVAGATVLLIQRGLLVQTETQVFPTAAGVRAIYAKEIQ